MAKVYFIKMNQKEQVDNLYYEGPECFYNNYDIREGDYAFIKLEKEGNPPIIKRLWRVKTGKKQNGIKFRMEFEKVSEFSPVTLNDFKALKIFNIDQNLLLKIERQLTGKSFFELNVDSTVFEDALKDFKNYIEDSNNYRKFVTIDNDDTKEDVALLKGASNEIILATRSFISDEVKESFQGSNFEVFEKLTKKQQKSKIINNNMFKFLNGSKDQPQWISLWDFFCANMKDVDAETQEKVTEVLKEYGNSTYENILQKIEEEKKYAKGQTKAKLERFEEAIKSFGEECFKEEAFKEFYLSKETKNQFLDYLSSEKYHNNNPNKIGTHKSYDTNLEKAINKGIKDNTITLEDAIDNETLIKKIDQLCSKNQNSSQKSALLAYKSFLKDKGFDDCEGGNDTPKDKGQEFKNEYPLKENYPLNQILYGPPGTGKTYNSVIYAVAICENKDKAEVEQEEYKEVFKRFKEYKSQGRIEFVTFHQSYGYEEFIQGIKPYTNNGQIGYKVEEGVFKKFCGKAKDKPEDKFVFIIDEINRGNVSKIFGELITLIEESKRIGKNEGMKVRLPYKDNDDKDVYFGVPNNVYILGTMNTADRSLVQLDAALRRRFRFIEMMPEEDVILGEDNQGNVKGINLRKLLKDINERITNLIDREHQIGHSYFTKVKNLNDLVEAFKYEIIPLLQEYFYEDYDGIREVLNSQIIEVGENKKSYKINLPKDKDMSGDMSNYKEVFTKILSPTDNTKTVSGLPDGKDEEL